MRRCTCSSSSEQTSTARDLASVFRGDPLNGRALPFDPADWIRFFRRRERVRLYREITMQLGIGPNDYAESRPPLPPSAPRSARNRQSAARLLGLALARVEFANQECETEAETHSKVRHPLEMATLEEMLVEVIEKIAKDDAFSHFYRAFYHEGVSLQAAFDLHVRGNLKTLE